jgi:hypothetical protein
MRFVAQDCGDFMRFAFLVVFVSLTVVIGSARAERVRTVIPRVTVNYLSLPPAAKTVSAWRTEPD